MSKCIGVGLSFGLKYIPNCTSYWNSPIGSAVGSETLAASLSDCNVKKAWRYLWSAEQLGISIAETPNAGSLQSFSELSSSDKKSRKDDVVWRVARGSSWKAVLLRYFWNYSSIRHWQNSKLLLFLLLLLLLLWFVRMKFTSWQVAWKRPWNHLVLVLRPLRGTEDSILQTTITICSCCSHNYLQPMDTSQSELIFPAVDLNHMKKRRCHCSWYSV